MPRWSVVAIPSYVVASTSKMLAGESDCNRRFELPVAGIRANDHNGVSLPDTCFNDTGPHYVLVIGDWGGVGSPPEPANCRQSDEIFVVGVDNSAQQRVARQMIANAAHTSPDYVLNVGDNFYWGGIDNHCGAKPFFYQPTQQFELFEKMYVGDGLSGKPWLGVLGNHDYGGYKFTSAWDQAIGYSWGPSGRWVTPAQYWKSRVVYPDFDVDYLFIDTNVFDAGPVTTDLEHNICSVKHNTENASCGPQGPYSLSDCPAWFAYTWAAQELWLEGLLTKSVADWQIVVAHHPPTWGRNFWMNLSYRHGIDLIVTGHVHQQELHYNEPDNFLWPTAWIVSGGGGGITSESTPSLKGDDDQYGFMELTLSKDLIHIRAISHGGQERHTASVQPRVKGNDTTPDVTSRRREDCFVSGVIYHPLDMAGTFPTEQADAASCQKRCNDLMGCSYFSYLHPHGECHLADGSATRQDNFPGFIAGPTSCSEDTPTLHLDCIEPFVLYLPYWPSRSRVLDSLISVPSAFYECQQNCIAVTDCAYFSVDFLTRLCTLAGSAAHKNHSDSAVSGPAICGSQNDQRKFLNVGKIAGPTPGVLVAFASTLGFCCVAFLGSVLFNRLACNMPEGMTFWINVGLVYPHVLASLPSRTLNHSGRYQPINSSREPTFRDALWDSEPRGLHCHEHDIVTE